MSEPSFLGFGAFETTAFLTSLIVAWYSLISNPSGRQSAFDSAEYQIFAGWRLALLAIITHIILMTVVIIQQAGASQVDSSARVWLLLLMIAPWAPIAGKVRDTLTSGARVRQMMKRRLVRNELSAILRDRFKFGQRSIAMPVVIYHASGRIPTFIIQTLNEQEGLKDFIKDLKHEAMLAAQLEESHSLELGSLWAMNQSLQPTSVSRLSLFVWKVVSNIDVLSRLWTVRACPVRVDVMPEIKSIVERARYLDLADLLQQGGTISDELAQRGLKRFCEKCRAAIRCAVEIFLESSERGHTDMRAGEWLKNVGMDWRGSFERVIDVMWEACFMDSKALRVQGDDNDQSPSFNDRTKVTTTKMLALLFLMARSVVSTKDDTAVFDDICIVIADGPFRREWWSQYWSIFAHKLRHRNNDHIVVDASCRSTFKACLREMVDQDMLKIVDHLLENGIHSGMCGSVRCFLNTAQLVAKKYGPTRRRQHSKNALQQDTKKEKRSSGGMVSIDLSS